MARARLQGWAPYAGLLLLASPLLAFGFLTELAPGLDRVVAVPERHFEIVSSVALLALLLAIIVGVASVRTREPRTLFVASAFLAISGVFAVHGLTTPGDAMFVKEMHHNLVISARLSLFFGSIFFLLSSFRPPKVVSAFISRNHGALVLGATALAAIYIGANLAKPDLLDWIPTGTAPRQSNASVSTGNTAPSYGGDYGYSYGASSTVETSPQSEPALTPAERTGRGIGYAMAIFTVVALIFAAFRYFESYDYTRSPATGALTVGLVLLAEAQVIMTLGENWHLSWWIYHVVMLVGFLIPVAAIGLAYRRGSNLAQIVDGFFVRDALAKIERSFPEAIGALISAIEKKDPYLRGHMRRVGQLTVDIAEELNLPRSVARAASNAALLHDIGKLGISHAILHKPGRLTDEEFEVMKLHPDRGYQLAMQSPALHSSAPAIRWHHERLDGSGYPDRIASDQIPIEARIVAVADVWDAMTSDRVYRKAMTVEQAKSILMSEAGVKLDRDCVQALFTVLERAATRPAAIEAPAANAPLDRSLPSLLAS